jgi:ankyrin repeat protein
MYTVDVKLCHYYYSRQTALHLAAREEVTVQHLLDLGAKCNARDANGWTPLHTVCATERGWSSDSAYNLLRAGAELQRFTSTADRSSSSTSSSDAEEHLQGGW